MRHRLEVVVVLTLLSFSMCAQQTPQAQSGPGTAEATKVATDYWRQYVSHCGDSYYVLYDYSVTEYKHVSFDVKAVAITEAEKLNGISWDGATYLHSKLARNINLGVAQPVWSQWLDTGGGGESLSMRKANGRWSVKDESRNLVRETHDCEWFARFGEGRAPTKTLASYHFTGDGCQMSQPADLELTDVNFTLKESGKPSVVWFYQSPPFRLTLQKGSDCYSLVISKVSENPAWAQAPSYDIFLPDEDPSKLEKMCQDILNAKQAWLKAYPHNAFSSWTDQNCHP